MPMMSPGQASSARLRSRARKKTGFWIAIMRPERPCFSFMPRRKRPEHRRRKATRRRRHRGDAAQELADAEIVECAAEEDRRQMTGAIGSKVEGPTEAAHHVD